MVLLPVLAHSIWTRSQLNALSNMRKRRSLEHTFQALFSAAFCCFSALSLNLLEQADAVLADDFRAAEELACQEAMPVAEVSRLTEADWHAGDRI